MRALASYLVGVFTLTALVSTGSAWQFQDSGMVPAVVSESLLVASAGDWFRVPREESPPSLLGDCLPPAAGSTCFSWDLVTPPPEILGPYDLVPEVANGAEDWRPLVAMFFKPEHVDRAIRIIRCESRGNPLAKNPTSTASGLFQHLGSQWGRRAVKAGWAGADVFDPVPNVAVASWLVYQGGGWSHWNASAHCW